MYINIEKKPVFNRSIYKGETAEPGKYRRRQGTGKYHRRIFPVPFLQYLRSVYSGEIMTSCIGFIFGCKRSDSLYSAAHEVEPCVHQKRLFSGREKLAVLSDTSYKDLLLRKSLLL